MRAGHQCVAYVMRRPAGFTPEQLVPFYRDVLGLPVVADHGDVVQHWVGGTTLLKLTFGADPPPPPLDPARLTCVPVLGSRDLAATVARLGAAGHPPVGELDTPSGRAVFVAGPDGLPTAFRQTARTQPPPALGAVPPLAPDLWGLTDVLLRVPDVAATTAFYTDVLGLDALPAAGDTRHMNARRVDLGDDVTLVIAPGGVADPAPPASRSDVPDSITLRLHDLDTLLESLRAAGTPLVGGVDSYPTGTRMAYACDPAGTLIGLAQRVDTGDYVEDVAATARWQARTATPLTTR